MLLNEQGAIKDLKKEDKKFIKWMKMTAQHTKTYGYEKAVFRWKLLAITVISYKLSVNVSYELRKTTNQTGKKYTKLTLHIILIF